MGASRPAAQLVLFHIGAGSIVHLHKYNKLLQDACLFAKGCASNICNSCSMQHFPTQKQTVLLSVQMVKFLEDCGMLNCGAGSNRNALNEIEGDASVLLWSPHTFCRFAAIGALKGCSNPISVANALLNVQLTQTFEDGVFAPAVLVGEGAQLFAQKQGLFNDEAASSFESVNKSANGPAEIAPKPHAIPGSDTVGCISFDLQSLTVSLASSSGGPAAKWPGRVGHVIFPGCASWCDASGDVIVFCVASGRGERLMMSGFCESLCKIVRNTSQPEILDAFFKSHAHYEYGVVGAKYFITKNTIELFVAHSTPQFGYGLCVVPAACSNEMCSVSNSDTHFHASVAAASSKLQLCKISSLHAQNSQSSKKGYHFEIKMISLNVY